MLLEHADPARRVALDDELLVVDVRVGVRPIFTQYGVHDSQQLVGGGEDGSFVADATGQHPVIVVELRACCETLPSHRHTESVAADRAVLGRRTYGSGS